MTNNTTTTIIVPERGRVAVPGDLVVVGDAVYRIVEHRGLCHDRGAAIAPGSGASNEWRYDAVCVGDIHDLTNDEYECAPNSAILEKARSLGWQG